MSDGDAGRPAGRRRWRRRESSDVPDAEGRPWVHPSELPDFSRVPVYDAVRARRRQLSGLIVLMALIVVALGMTVLATQSSTPPTTSPLTSHVARSVRQLPTELRGAARSAIALVITTDGHVSSGAALVIAPGNLAVTTTPVPPGSSLFGATQSGVRTSVTVVDRETPLGITVLRLADTLPVAPTSTLPDAAQVVALSPWFTPDKLSPSFAWGNTTLGDPQIEQSDGVVSYLATSPASDLSGFVDTLAVDEQGDVVAVLNSKDLWLSASYVTRVAQVVAQHQGCHGRLGVRAASAQGGGVLVESVSHGPSWGLLRRDDVLTSIDGTQLGSLDTLLSYLYAAAPDSRVPVGVLREGRPMTVDITLGCQP